MSHAGASAFFRSMTARYQDLAQRYREQGKLKAAAVLDGLAEDYKVQEAICRQVVSGRSIDSFTETTKEMAG